MCVSMWKERVSAAYHRIPTRDNSIARGYTSGVMVVLICRLTCESALRSETSEIYSVMAKGSSSGSYRNAISVHAIGCYAYDGRDWKHPLYMFTGRYLKHS
jgi:hypothetical protein